MCIPLTLIMATRKKPAQNRKKNKNKIKGVKKYRPRVMSAATEWLKLLADPCGGNLVSPCYSGTDSGYLVRTTDNVAITATGSGMVAGTTVACSLILSYSPSATTSGTTNAAYLATAFAPGGADPGSITASGTSSTVFSGLPVTNFINNSTTPVNRYRPVASCLRWVPTGPYASRQGVVGLGYSAGAVLNQSGLVSYNSYQALQQHYAPNGSETHEVRWLPTLVDERFTSNETNVVGGGTLTLMLRGVDGVASSATSALINGYIEVTTVWEWTPAATTGLVLAPKVPNPFTTQGVLSTITDLGAFLFGGVVGGMGTMGTRLGAGVVTGAASAVNQLLTRGVGRVASRPPVMLVAG